MDVTQQTNESYIIEFENKTRGTDGYGLLT